MPRTCALALVVAVAACGGHAPPPPGPAPDFHPIAAEPIAGGRTKVYVDCLSDAIAHQQIARAHDESMGLLVFTCTGDAAAAFYTELGAWSAKLGSEVQRDGRTYRTTARVRHDLFGVDYCSTDGTTHECRVSLNGGEFLR